MPTTITLENAQLADCFAKANRLAPFKGEAYDKAGGFLIDVHPSLSRITVRSTDLDSTYLQHVPTLKAEGDEVTWRLPSIMLTSMLQGLPLGGDHSITFFDRGDSFIRLKSDKWVAKLHTMRPGDFPIIPEFDTEGMSPADDLATKVDQVTWACDPKTDILAGVHLDGNRLVGCNRYALAVVPCAVPLSDPVTVPLSSLSGILKVATEVQLRAVERKLEISLDSETQATSRLIEGDYPPIDRIMRTNFRGSVTANRTTLVEALNRMLVLVRSERMPTMQVTFDGSNLLRCMTFDMEVEQVGRMQDSVHVEGDWEDVMTLHIKPKMLVDAVDHSKADTVTMWFGNSDDPTKDALGTLVIKDDRGYQCHLSAIRVQS